MKKLGLLLIPILALAFLGCPPKQDCISFDYNQAEVKNVDGRWKIVSGSMSLLDFEDKESEARQSLQIIKHYKMNKQCFVGRPDASMEYYLVNGKSPVGSFPGEDCIPFDPDNIEVKKISDRWQIVDGDLYLLDFQDKEDEARLSFRIIKYHEFSRICYVGRPYASMIYYRQ